MYEQVEKSKENKNRVVANSVTQNKSNTMQSIGFVDNRPETITQRKLQEVLCNSVIQRVPISGINVVASGNMPQWVQGGLTYHLNMTTDPAHITCEDWPVKLKKDKWSSTKMHFFFKGSQGSIVDAVSGQRGKLKFSNLPQEVQTFVNDNYDAILRVL
jgi:hypothetical protein